MTPVPASTVGKPTTLSVTPSSEMGVRPVTGDTEPTRDAASWPVDSLDRTPTYVVGSGLGYQEKAEVSMAHFYGEISGGRSSVSRTGHKSSGFEGHLRGWGMGVRVELSHRDGKDIAEIYSTGGSNARTSELLIATITSGKDGPEIVLHQEEGVKIAAKV